MMQVLLRLMLILAFFIGIAAKIAPAQAAACLPGYVWRDARPGDTVCVIPQSRALAADENAKAVSRREPGPRGGVYYCLTGYVWREAYGGDTVCVIPAARDRVREENRLSASRTVGGAPDFRSPGDHVLLVGVVGGRNAHDEKTYRSTCGYLDPFPGPMRGMVGWGQAEIGWLGDNCFAFVLERAVRFDTTLLDMVPTKAINRVVLSYDEVEAPSCPLVAGYAYRCWQNGNGKYEQKRDGCAVVRVPTVDWVRNGGQYPGRLPAQGGARRINARQWDVTNAIGWQLVPSSVPLGAFTKGYGLLLTGGPSIDGLTAQDNTVCVSELSNITLEVAYTVPPQGGPFRPPH